MAVFSAAICLSCGPLSAQDSVDCLVRAQEVARIGAATRGVVEQIHVDRADRVRQGEVLAELEASAEAAQVALAKLKLGSDIAVRLAQAKAETAELRAERLTRLGRQNLVPRSEQEEAMLAARTARLEEEQARLDLRVAGVELAAAEAALERKRIRAPFDGVVTDRLMSVGELYNEQEPMLVVARIDPLVVDSYLPGDMREAVSAGMEARLVLESGQEVMAKVDVIDPVLDAATGTFGIRLGLPNPEGAILAGQSCQLWLGGGAN
ncbi:efflux RND transporter periplasmic adaptor subunit [Mesobacterium pallidum]|uniref:efflux RND transporter periplasmic adaptor subunit n=1 Tax=Mesobacterium pallidum TaxID=2872037 RepID=UPI001EE2E379|nr:efflux RND transporter periplasmic adaptor subunit [Mesobacterium pallidum]